MSCSKCNSVLSEKEIKYKIICDFCNNAHCLACAKFSTSEAQVTQMKTRMMLFACESCLPNVKKQQDVFPNWLNDAKFQLKNICETFCETISNSLSSKLEALSLPKQPNVNFVNNPHEKRIYELEIKNIQLESRILSLEERLQQLLSPQLENKAGQPVSMQNFSHALLQTTTQETLNKYINLAQPDTSRENRMIHPKSSAVSKPAHPNSHGTQPSMQSKPGRYSGRSIIIGTSTNDKVFTAAERRQWLYIGRCNPNTTEQQITDYIKNQLCISDVQCILLDRNDDVSSFKVGVKESLLKGLLDHNLWPAGTAVKEFRPRRSNRPSNSANFQQLDLETIPH